MAVDLDACPRDPLPNLDRYDVLWFRHEVRADGDFRGATTLILG